MLDAVARGFRFFRGRKKTKEEKGRGAHFEWALRHSHARHTAPYHPQPTGGLCQGPCGSGGHCRGRGLPQGHHNGPEEATAGPRHTSSALPRPRPVGHQSAPWPHQTPTKHPREVPTFPLGLGRPLGHCRGAGDGQTAPCEFRLSPGCAVGLQHTTAVFAAQVGHTFHQPEVRNKPKWRKSLK